MGKSEEWRDIPGFDGFYQISRDGRVRSYRSPHGRREEPKEMSLHISRTGKCIRHKQVCVRLLKPDGSQTKKTVLSLMVITWFPEHGHKVAYLKSGIMTDLYIENIGFATHTQIGTMFAGKANRRPVAKIDRNGEVMEFYPSARAAAKKNYVSPSVVEDRCNGKTKDEFRWMDFSFRWDR